MGVPLLPRTIVLSVGMHFAVAVAAFRAPEAPARDDLPPAPDVWSGQAVEVDRVTLPGEETSTGEASPREPENAAAPERAPEPVPAAAPAPAPLTKSESEAEPHPEPVAKSARKAEPPREVRPRPAPSSAPASSGSENEQLTAAPTSAPPEAGARGAFGTTGLPQGVRHLPKAFTRTLTEALSGDKTWSTLPLGPAGEIEIAIPVDSEGKLGELSYPKPNLAEKQVAVVKHAVERTMLMLRAGTFSLAPSQLQNGVQRLRIEFEVSGGASEGDDDVDRFQKGFVEPSGGRPGRSYFVSSAGRRVDALVYVVP
jgi:hypothetical protein